nr:helix-turn-helix transcriptional regulator [uncultured Methylotenera sp.]
MEINEAFGQALKQARLAKGLTQEDFSDVSSRTYISTLEREIFSPTIDKVDGLSNYMNIHPLTLLTLTYLNKDKKLHIDKLEKLIREQISSINLGQTNP